MDEKKTRQISSSLLPDERPFTKKNLENLMTCKCTIQIPVDVAKIVSVVQKFAYVQKILALILAPNSGELVRRAMKNMMRF